MAMIFLPDSQLRASRTRVRANFLVCSSHHFFCQYLAVRQRTKTVLHDPIFKRMKTDHSQTAAGPQAGWSRIQEELEIFQLRIHRNAQALKGSSCGMDMSVMGRAENSLDSTHKIERRPKRTRSDDGSRDGTR